jgi:hypothetical protein
MERDRNVTRLGLGLVAELPREVLVELVQVTPPPCMGKL